MIRKYLIFGRTGVGKSSFINSVFGEETAKTAKFEPCTKIIQRHVDSIRYGKICIVDTPGFGEINNEIRKALELKKFIKKNHIEKFIFVSSLRERRLRGDELNMLKTITNIVGKKIWKRTWLILTFANDYENKKDRDEAAHNRNIGIHDFLFENYPKLYKGKLLFEQVILIDNVSNDWCTNADYIDTAFK